MRTSRGHKYSYRRAGVDIDAGHALVERIGPLAAATARPGADAALGGFGGLFDLGAVLLNPTRIYARSVLDALGAGIKGLAHITGGGVIENLPRILPEGTAALLDAPRWPLAPVFRWLAADIGVETGEMLRTFNCGLGMIAVVGAGEADTVERVLARAGETVDRVGEIVARAPDGPTVTVSGTELWRR